MIYFISIILFWVSMCAYTVIIARKYNKEQKRIKLISSSSILLMFLFLTIPSMFWLLILLFYIIKIIIGKIIGEKEALSIKKIIIEMLTEDWE